MKGIPPPFTKILGIISCSPNANTVGFAKILKVGYSAPNNYWRGLVSHTPLLAILLQFTNSTERLIKGMVLYAPNPL